MGARGTRAAERGRERGVALLVVLTAIAVLTAVSVDLAYNTRVSLQLAANARDELRAYYLAKSAVAMSRLVLHFQTRLDAMAGAQAGAVQALASAGRTQGPAAPAGAAGGGAQGAAAGAASALSGLGTSVRLWEIVPVDSSVTALFLGNAAGAAAERPPARRPEPPRRTADGGTPPRAADGGSEARQAGAAQPVGERRAFGDVEGSFHAEIEDEERKINLRQLDAIGLLPGVQAMRLAQLVRDPRWDFLFDEDDANGIRVARKDVFAAVKDWEDLDETSSAFTGDPARPFENGFGDENAIYDRLPDRYKAKNAPFDSLDELYQVAGVGDAFMGAFGDRLTVYPAVDAPINVNTTDPEGLLVNALILSDPPGLPQPATADPAFLTKLQSALVLARPLPFLSMTAQQFAVVLQALGVKVSPIYLSTRDEARRNPFGDRSATFHIRAVGSAGEVRKTIDAVVTFDRRAEALAQDQGRLLHWREE